MASKNGREIKFRAIAHALQNAIHGAASKRTQSSANMYLANTDAQLKASRKARREASAEVPPDAESKLAEASGAYQRLANVVKASCPRDFLSCSQDDHQRSTIACDSCANGTLHRSSMCVTCA